MKTNCNLHSLFLCSSLIAAKGKYIGAPCNNMTCEPTLLHVSCDKETQKCGCERNYPVQIGLTRGCDKRKYIFLNSSICQKQLPQNNFRFNILSYSKLFHMRVHWTSWKRSGMILVVLQPRNWVKCVSSTRHASTMMKTPFVFRCATMRCVSVRMAIIRWAIINRHAESSVLKVSATIIYLRFKRRTN